MDNFNWNNTFPDTPKSFKNKVSATLNSLPDQKENYEMRNMKSFKKRIMIGLVAAMVIGTTVFAAGKVVFINSHGSNIPNYTAIPTVEQVKKDLGFNPKLVKEFDNEYAFKGGYTIDNEVAYENENSVEKTKSISFAYTKGKDEIMLYMENGKLGEESEEETVVDTHNGIDLYYYSYANKSVPATYKMTEQDKQDELSGKYVFSYGSDKEKISEVQGLNWMQDGIYYSFLAVDSDLSQGELVKMAKQIIDAK